MPQSALTLFEGYSDTLYSHDTGTMTYHDTDNNNNIDD